MPNSYTPVPPRHSQKNVDTFFKNDKSFDLIYPENIRSKTQLHWTPLSVAKSAAQFLAAESNSRVLDIGSGVGKFCLAGAFFNPEVSFCGVEQRKDLVEYAINCNERVGLENVCFIHGNFTQLDFRPFQHFYFYNSFYENLEGSDKIDDKIEYSLSLFNYYNRYLYHELDKKPKGTRIATFHSLEGEIPPGYYAVQSQFNESLKYWIKI